MNIYIIVEIKKREFLSRLLLGLEAALNGHQIYLGNIAPLISRKIIKPGLIHHKSLTPNWFRSKELQRYKKLKFKVTSQDEEVGVGFNGIEDYTRIRYGSKTIKLNGIEDYTRIRYGSKTIKLIEYLFTWGKSDYYNLSKRYKKFKKKIVNSGNPRVDFWRKDFQKFYGRKNKKKFILISSNFESLFSVKTFFERYKILNDSGYFKLGSSKKVMFNSLIIETILIKHFIESVTNLSKKFKNKIFVFRPHPVEKVEEWKFIFKDCKNVIVRNHKDIGFELNNTELVIHNGCTVGLESSVRGIPTVSFMPIKETKGHPIANKVSLVVKNEFQLTKVINKLLNKKNFTKKKNIINNVSEKTFENINSGPSYKKIIKIWNSIDDKSLKKKNNDNIIKGYFNLKKFKNKLLSNNYINSKFSDFTTEEINLLKKKFDLLDPNFKKLKIEILGKDCLKISHVRKN